MEKTVKLIECFRHTFQGEGVDSGKRVTLLRFKYCNKGCKYCDTAVKMRVSQEAEYKLSDLQSILDEEKTTPLITGGEPTIDKHFNDTLSIINNLVYSYPANLETNGYNLLALMGKINKDKLVNISYSPKIFNAFDLKEEIQKTYSFVSYPNIYFKVVFENNDLIREYLQTLVSLNVNHRVWLMAEGISREQLIMKSEYVLDACEKYKFNFSSREHIVFNFI